jgi:heptaprenyl diphosphate synthase
LNIIEGWLPPVLVFAPGTKMGLSNIISFISLITLGPVDAYIIVIVKCLLSSIFGGNAFSLVYSLSAGLISLTAMLIFYKLLCPFISVVSVSVLGAFVHNLVQVSIYALIAQTRLVVLLMFSFIFASIVAGLIVGICVFLLTRSIPREYFIVYNKSKKNLKKNTG